MPFERVRNGKQGEPLDASGRRVISRFCVRSSPRRRSQCARGKAEWNRLIGRVTVVDARTLEFADGTRVALGLNAPEPGQQGLIDGKLYPCEKEATDFLRKLIGDQPVTCIRDLDDDVCIGCYVGDENIKHAMVINGWALANHSSLHPAEIIARENKRGLWRGQFVTPAEWRAGKRLPGEK